MWLATVLVIQACSAVATSLGICTSACLLGGSPFFDVKCLIILYWAGENMHFQFAAEVHVVRLAENFDKTRTARAQVMMGASARLRLPRYPELCIVVPFICIKYSSSLFLSITVPLSCSLASSLRSHSQTSTQSTSNVYAEGTL